MGRRDTEGEQPLALCGEVLFGGRDAGVADADASNGLSVAVRGAITAHFIVRVLRASLIRGPAATAARPVRAR